MYQVITAKNSGQWMETKDALTWDSQLASMNGHPLQSALWGNARESVDGVSQLLLEYRTNAGVVSGLARIEKRTIPLIGKIAWMPKGPVLSNGVEAISEALLHMELRRYGFMACITDRYTVSLVPNTKCPRTIWLDLTLGLDKLSDDLDSQWRYGANRALREGVIVRKTVEPTEVSAFFHLCNALSMKKGFALPGSEALMQELIRSTSPGVKVGMFLYVGDVGGVIAGGALVARSGRNLHYFWGASDRRFSKCRVSEAIHWRIIQDGVTAGMARYDLEGIDPVGNSGVYQFKRKMGGNEVVLQGMEAAPLSMRGRVIVGVGHRLRRFG